MIDFTGCVWNVTFVAEFVVVVRVVVVDDDVVGVLEIE